MAPRGGGKDPREDRGPAGLETRGVEQPGGNAEPVDRDLVCGPEQAPKRRRDDERAIGPATCRPVERGCVECLMEDTAVDLERRARR